MDVHLDDLVVIDHHNAVPDRFKKRAQRQRAFFALPAQNDEFGAVGKGDFAREPVVILKEGGGRFLLGRSGNRARERNDDIIADHRGHALKDDQQTLAARINHSRLFQHRQHLRGLFQHFRGGLRQLAPEFGDIFSGLARGLSRFFGGSARNGEDGPLGRLHHRLVGGLHAQRKRIGDIGGGGGALACQPLRESAEKQGKDDAGISPGPAQQRGSGSLGNLFDRGIVVQTLKLPLGRRDSHRHIGSRIAVRHREDIERINLLAIVRNMVRPRNDCIPEGFPL